MFSSNSEFNAYSLGRSSSGGITPSGGSSLDMEKREASLMAVRDALVLALMEVAPDHPLTKKENRNRIAKGAYDAFATKRD